MKKIDTAPEKYVVLDVETNGRRSKTDDLLSISFYKPDDGKEYNKFLPLELNKKITTTKINGITEQNLYGATALTQAEFDHIVEEFELERRTILFYAGGDFDKTFLLAYMNRHNISGFEKLTFYNFKRNIVSSRFSTGTISKDNLCSLFGIEGVEAVHSGSNDCILEWKLFQKMDGYFYLVTAGNYLDNTANCICVDNIFRLNDAYIIPAGLFTSHPNLSRVLSDRPYIECQSMPMKSFEIDAKGIEKFPTNFTGMTIEHLINSMLNADEQDSFPFLYDNKRKLDYIGNIPNKKLTVPMIFNLDGTITAICKEDKEIEKRLNATTDNLKAQIRPLIDFVRCEIFQNEHILSQELVIDSKNNVLALCDLSTKNAILEIKTNSSDPLAYKEQLFYESNGRPIYYLNMEWVKDRNSEVLKKIIFRIYSVDAHIGTPSSPNWAMGKREAKRLDRITELRNYLSPLNISLVSYINTSLPIKLQCNVCEHEWTVSYATLIKKTPPKCPICSPKIAGKKCPEISAEEREKLRADNYLEKILQKSNHTIAAIHYTGAKNDVDAICLVCNHKWKVRADHLVARCWCPACKKKNATSTSGQIVPK